MIKSLKKYSVYLREHLNEEIKSDELFERELRSNLLDCFSKYSPNKERGYLINRIAQSYDFDIKLVLFLELGLEVIFASYYLRDDLIDNPEFIMNKKTSNFEKTKLSLIADILNEVGNEFIAKYLHKIESGCQARYIFKGFQILSIGQLYSLNADLFKQSILKSLRLAYKKNGALMKYSINMLRPLFGLANDFHLIENMVVIFGVASQIRNDIEDFLKNDKKSELIMLDLKNMQSNFVLSVFVENLKKKFTDSKLIKNKIKSLYENRHSQDSVFNLLEEEKALSISIRYLDYMKEKICNDLKKLENQSCRYNLEKISKTCLNIL